MSTESELVELLQTGLQLTSGCQLHPDVDAEAFLAWEARVREVCRGSETDGRAAKSKNHLVRVRAWLLEQAEAMVSPMTIPIYVAIDDEEYAEARRLIALLEAEWGADDPDAVRARTFLDLEEHVAAGRQAPRRSKERST